jgi:hypothetical protein
MRFVLPGMDAFQTFGFSVGSSTHTSQTGTAVREQQHVVAKLPSCQGTLHGELIVSSLAPVAAPNIVPGEGCSEGQETRGNVDAPQSSPRNSSNESTTASTLHLDTPRVCPVQNAVSAGKTGLFLAQNSRSFLIHTRSFTVTGWGHVFLKQRLGHVVVDIHWPAKPLRQASNPS